MKFAIPEISWHNRDPVLSVDFQPKCEENGPLRLATGGTDTHVLIWYISTTEAGSVNLEVAADLTRHQKAVNVVRWSPNGQLLASGDDDSIIFVWKQKFEKESVSSIEQPEEQYKETWVIHKTLRGHMEDVLDISWSPDSLFLASGSVDNKLLIWDIGKGKYTCILSDHKGFVQGVAWDPKGQMIATASTDRTFRTFDVSSRKVRSRSSKAVLPFAAPHPLHAAPARLYHDDTLQTYFRRLHFSPDGSLVAVPAGRIDADHAKDWKPVDAVYIYTRWCLKVPVCVMAVREAALCVRWSPALYAARAGAAPALPTPRMVLAVGTRHSLLLYDTHQRTPLALIANMHYTRLTDLSWSPDGLTLVASSTDGFCSIVTFTVGELGEVIPLDVVENKPPEPMEVQTEDRPAETTKSMEPEPEKKVEPKSKDSKSTPKIDSYIKFKAPEKSPKKQKTEPKQKTPVKIDVLEEVAMPSWSDNSNNEIIRPKETKQMEVDKSEIMVIEDSEDMKLVYEETQEAKSSERSPKSLSPKEGSRSLSSATENTFLKTAKVTDVKEQVQAKAVASPKAPRRVNLITLSSPKNKKKF